MIVIICTA